MKGVTVALTKRFVGVCVEQITSVPSLEVRPRQFIREKVVDPLEPILETGVPGVILLLGVDVPART